MSSAALEQASPFAPPASGSPELSPRPSAGSPRRWLAARSALAHGNSPGGAPIALAAIAALDGLDDDRARICLDLIRASLNDDARRALEDEMQVGNYEISSTIARYFEEQGQLRPIEACREPDYLMALFSQINAARDRRTIQRLGAAR